MTDNKEVFVEIRNGGKDISIQSPGIGDDPKAAREILQNAIDALDSDQEKQLFRGEIVVKLPIVPVLIIAAIAAYIYLT